MTGESGHRSGSPAFAQHKRDSKEPSFESRELYTSGGGDPRVRSAISFVGAGVAW